METYRHSIKMLEKSIPKAASENPRSLKIAKKLAKRADDFLNALVILELKNNDIPVTPQTMRENKQKFISENLFQGVLDEDASKLSGYVGRDVDTLESLIQNGNLREILLNYGMLFLRNIITPYWKDKSKGIERLEKVNIILKEDLKADWTIDIGKLFDNKLGIKFFPSSGPYGILNFSKKLRKLNEPDKANEKAKLVSPKLSELFIPLSEREKKFVKINGDRLSWVTGEAYFEKVTYNKQNTHPYLFAVQEVGVPVMAGISGTLDNYMHLSCILGLCKYEDLLDIQLASLAELVGTRHHTAVEVFYSSKSFGFKFTLGPEYYKFIYPTDPGFLYKLRGIQKSFSATLPDEVLDNCVCQKMKDKDKDKGKCNLIEWKPYIKRSYLN